MDPRENVWRWEIVNSLFNARDRDEIRKMTLGSNLSEDKRIWKYHSKGTYTVKLAYRFTMDSLIDNDAYKVPGDWMKIWKMKIPQRVKIFIWRIARGCLPTRDRIQNKGVQCTDMCPHCETTYENEWHLFLSCNNAKEVWMEAAMWEDVNRIAAAVTDFTAFIFAAITTLTESRACDVVMMLWCLWKRRNEKVWDEVVQPVRVSMQKARDLLFQWRVIRQKEDVAGNNNSSSNIHWQPPVNGEVKCNIDAALFIDQHKFGIGMCIRNDRGAFQKAKTMWFNGVPPPEEAEAWALKEAIIWLRELGLPKVVIELDCLLVVNAMKGGYINHSEFGNIIEECRRMLGNDANFKISFVKRQVNFVAHTLARASKNYASSQSFDLIPSCIITILMNEII